MILIRQNNRITLEDGTQLPIADLKLGHQVQGETSINSVIRITQKLAQRPLWELSDFLVGVSSSQLFKREVDEAWVAIEPHEALVENPHLTIKQLRQNARILTDEGAVEVEYLRELPQSEKLVCVEIELDGDNTFYLNGHLCHNKGDGGSSGGGGTTVTKTEPPEYLRPYLTDIAKQAQLAYREVPTEGFSGQLVASPTTAQQQALQQQKNIAAGLGGFGDTTAQIAGQQANKVLSGSYTAPAATQFQQTNVGTTDAVNAYLEPVRRQLQEDIIPQLTSNAIAQGAYGGSRYTTDLGKQITENYTNKAADLASQIGYGEAVRQDEQRFNNFITNQELLPELLKLEQAAALTAPELATAGVNQQLMPSSILAQAGQAEQLFNQDVLDEAYQQYLLEIAGPFAGLDQYASIIGATMGGGTTTTTGTGAKPSGGSNFLSGALGGGMAGLGAAQMLALSNPWTAGLAAGGAILGGLLG